MSLNEAYRKRMPLVIVDPIGGTRIIAAMVIDANRLAYAQDGWSMGATSHPLHIVEGEISGHGPWHIGAATIRVLDKEEDLMGLWNDWSGTEEPAARSRVEGMLRDLLR